MIPIDTGGIREHFVAETRQKFADAGYDLSTVEVDILVTKLPSSLYETLFDRVLQPMHGAEARPAPRTNEIYIDQAKRITDLQAENERLRVCGNCNHCEMDYGCEFGADTAMCESCVYSPSRWKRRKS